MAPEAAGDPSNRGKGGAAGYFKWLLAKYPLAYLSAFEHILPLEIIREHHEKEKADAKEEFVNRVSRIIEGLIRAKEEGAADDVLEQTAND
jgi:hypothetical protein